MKKSLNKFFVWVLNLFREKYWYFCYETFRDKYQIDKSFKFKGVGIQFYGEGDIVCRKNSYIASYSTLSATKGQKIVIGSDCAISHNVRIYTSKYIANQDMSEYPRRVKTGDVTIGDAVWIGVNVYIGPGVQVGNNSIIGANSVVVNDVAANCIVSGIPAKVIRYKRL